MQHHPAANQSTANADNRDLQPLSSGSIAIGCISDVNGENSHEVPEFVVTRAELIELVKYWEEVFLDRALLIFDTHQIGSTDLRLATFAERRVVRIVELLGDDAASAVQQVINGFANSMGGEEWKRFREYLGPKHLHGRPGPV